MNKSLDRRQAAESDNPSTGVTQVPLQRIEPHLDPGCIYLLRTQTAPTPLMTSRLGFPPTEMYSLHDYGEMIADAGRFSAYAKAIAAAVRPGDIVAEIGCGPGVFSLLACRAGARRVFAIESEDSIQFARELAATNGFTDRIEFFQSDSRKIELPERANVIVSDIRGVLPLHDHAVPSLEDARQRLLAPGGIMIPQRDTLKAAVIEADEYYSRLTSPWRNLIPEVDLSSSLLPVLNQSYSVSFRNDQLLTEAQNWGLLDYTVGAATRASAELDFHAAREGTAHGVCLWFETRLFEEIGYSSGAGGCGNHIWPTVSPLA